MITFCPQVWFGRSIILQIYYRLDLVGCDCEPSTGSGGDPTTGIDCYYGSIQNLVSGVGYI